VELGWNYYKNLNEKDFQRAINFSSLFAVHRFWVNWNHYDLLFAGIKGAEMPCGTLLKSWENATTAIEEWVERESGGRVHTYRRIAAGVFGERWFIAMHRLLEISSWLHRPR
jgi:hypothetical protein